MKREKLGLIKNRKGIILGTIVVAMSVSLTACGTNVATSKNDGEIVQDKETENVQGDVENNKPREEKVTESNTTNSSTNKKEETGDKSNKAEETSHIDNNNNNNNIHNNTNTSESSNGTSQAQITDGLTSSTYTSNNLGLTFKVPESWKGKYNVIEENGKISVFMKHKDNDKGIGLLFVIKKQGVDAYEVLNSIDGIDSVDINGEKLIVGGPTGYCMEDGDKLIPIYNKMVGECVYPVTTIKAK